MEAQESAVDLHQRLLKAAVTGEAAGVLEPEDLMGVHLRCKQAATEAFIKDAIPVRERVVPTLKLHAWFGCRGVGGGAAGAGGLVCQPATGTLSMRVISPLLCMRLPFLHLHPGL